MTKISSSLAVLATAFLITASISSAHAGWGSNGQYGNAPGQATTSAPAPAPQAGGYGGGQTRPAETWNRPSTQTQTTNTYPSRPQVMCVRAPCNVNVQRPTYERPTYERPTHVERPVYAPQRPTYVERPVYVPQRPTYERPTYVERPVYAPQRPTYVERPVYAPQRPVYERPAHHTGSVYGGSTSSSRPAQTTGSWNTSGGYGGR